MITSSFSLDLLSSKMICKSTADLVGHNNQRDSCCHAHMGQQCRAMSDPTFSFAVPLLFGFVVLSESACFEGTRSDCMPRNTSNRMSPTTKGRDMPCPPFNGMNMVKAGCHACERALQSLEDNSDQFGKVA